MKKVAVVILNWNGRSYLSKFLPKVLEYSLQVADVYVADNGSTDDSVAFINANFPQVRLIELSKNYGFAEGYNRALKEVGADYYVILNSDVEVTSGWLSSIDNILEKNHEIGACQPIIRSYNQKCFFEYAGAAGGFIDKYGYPFCRGRLLNVIEKDNKQYNKSLEIFWATGACLIIRGKLFHEVGGFDGDFFAHMEEIDLCWRLKSAGYKIIADANSHVFHVGGGTLPNDNPRKLYLNFRNNLWLLYKNLPSEGFLIILFFRLLLDGIAGIKFLFTLNFWGFWVVLKAHASFYLSLPKLYKKRKIVQKKAVVNSFPQVYPRSIVYDFFVKRKKYFSDLKIDTKYL